MFVRKNINRSGSVSVQVVSKRDGKYLVVKSFGSSFDVKEINELEKEAMFFVAHEEEKHRVQYQLFPLEDNDDVAVQQFVKTLNNANIVNIGPELILGKIFDSIGLNSIPEELFRHIVLCRIVYPVSKLKTTEYLAKHHGINVAVSSIYRFLDRFHKQYKEKVETIVYEYSKRILGNIAIVFYDMTTLYFEAEDEDDLRKIGFSKDGKFQCPQIMIGLLVGKDGYPIAYEMFEGNTFEGKTMIPVIERMQNKYNLPKPIVVADSGLLSKENIKNLQEKNYDFILGARIKNETQKIQTEILIKTKNLKNGENVVLEKSDQTILIVSFSDKRAKKDAFNRDKGVKKLREKFTSGKLAKQQINNRGYNKFLSIKDDIKVEINESKILEDAQWDGLKGYITNLKIPPAEVIGNYKHLWQIEKAFRISKTDLRLRPIFHHKKERIEAHLCIAFAAYAVYKELDRRLALAKFGISTIQAIDLTKNMYQIIYSLPKSQKKVSQILHPSPKQQDLLKILDY